MCSKCDRHELWGGLCLDHLREERLVPALSKEEMGKEFKVAIDAIELVGADAAVTEERNDDDE